MKQTTICAALVCGIVAPVPVAGAGQPEEPVFPIRSRPVDGAAVRFTSDHTELYVATDGNDSAPGTKEQPFASLEAARGKVLQANLKALGITEYGKPEDLKRSLELFCNDKRMQLARWPNKGFAAYGEEVEGPHLRFKYVDNRSDRWGQAEDILVNGFWRVDWVDEIIPVTGVDTEKREITLERNPGCGFSGGGRFYAFNLLEEIDVPGEWYLDGERGILYLWPPDDFPSRGVLVSLLQSPFVSMEQTSFVTIRGLAMQAARATAVDVAGGTHNLIAGCTIRNVSSSGVDIDGGTGNGVLGCNIHDVGLEGVELSGGNRSRLIPAGNYVENCHIHHFARHKKTSQPAVQIGGVGNRAAHNLIHDAPHQAISKITWTPRVSLPAESSFWPTGCDVGR